jgi:hypothetical protein
VHCLSRVTEITRLPTPTTHHTGRAAGSNRGRMVLHDSTRGRVGQQTATHGTIPAPPGARKRVTHPSIAGSGEESTEKTDVEAGTRRRFPRIIESPRRAATRSDSTPLTTATWVLSARYGHCLLAIASLGGYIAFNRPGGHGRPLTRRFEKSNTGFGKRDQRGRAWIGMGAEMGSKTARGGTALSAYNTDLARCLKQASIPSLSFRSPPLTLSLRSSRP